MPPLCAKNQIKKEFESITSQHFQIFSCGSFAQQLRYDDEPRPVYA
jgi:hypothetical protein